MEFVSKSEVGNLLREHGYEEVSDDQGRCHIAMREQDGVVHMHFAAEDCSCVPREKAEVIKSATDALPTIVEQIIHRLNLNELMLIPVSKWRNVFDAVAFSMASNESWQEIDAAATVELNTRDTLMCAPGDFHLVVDLVKALINDAEGPDQGLVITSTAVPVIAEIVPDGALRLAVGNRALADEIMDVVRA